MHEYSKPSEHGDTDPSNKKRPHSISDRDVKAVGTNKTAGEGTGRARGGGRAAALTGMGEPPGTVPRFKEGGGH